MSNLYSQKEQEAALKRHGCKCPDGGLLGTRPGVGPRCRLCNTQITWEQVAEDAQRLKHKEKHDRHG